MAEYLSTVTDPKLLESLTLNGLVDYSLAIERGRPTGSTCSQERPCTQCTNKWGWNRYACLNYPANCTKTSVTHTLPTDNTPKLFETMTDNKDLPGKVQQCANTHSEICHPSWQVKDIQRNKTTDALSSVYSCLINTMLISVHRYTYKLDSFKSYFTFLYVYPLLQCPHSSIFLLSYHYLSAYMRFAIKKQKGIYRKHK